MVLQKRFRGELIESSSSSASRLLEIELKSSRGASPPPLIRRARARHQIPFRVYTQ